MMECLGRRSEASGAGIGSHRAQRTWVGKTEEQSEEGAKGAGWDTRLILQAGCSITSGELAPLKGPQQDRWKETVEKINLLGKK